MKKSTLVSALAGILLLSISVARADEVQYAPWTGQARAGDMPELLRNLSALADKAEHDKAANPAFLADLRKMIGEYENHYRWPVALLFDDFRDGEFASNPSWTVVAGSWQITNRGGSNSLVSGVRGDRGYGGQSNSSNSGNVVSNVLGALLNQQNGQGQNQPDQGQSSQYQQGRDASAAIMAPVSISDQFYIRLALVSRHGIQFDFGPYAGRHAQDSYQVTYAAGAANGLILSRVSNQGSQLLGQSRGPINLEDNQSHVFEWKRGPAGKMSVILDGRLVIEASDAGTHRPFSGFLMVNSGGTLAIQSVAINGTDQ